MQSPGPRGEQTKQRLLDATQSLLAKTGYRDLRVADIARLAGTSPATFYNYFTDVEAALAALMKTVVADADQRLRAPLDAEPWTPATVEQRSVVLAEEFLAFWNDHQALIGVVDLRAAEGVGALKDMRAQLLTGASRALESMYRRQGRSDAKALAFVHVAMLANVAAHQRGMVAAGVPQAELVRTLAQTLAQPFGAGLTH